LVFLAPRLGRGLESTIDQYVAKLRVVGSSYFLPPLVFAAASPVSSSSCAEPGFFAMRNSSVAPLSCAPSWAERTEEVIEEDLRFALFIAL
jgi:hypothetical protein